MGSTSQQSATAFVQPDFITVITYYALTIVMFTYL